MFKMLRASLALALALSAAAVLTACQQTTPGADEAAKQIEENTDAKQAAVSAMISAAQTAVDEVADAAGGLEAQVQGLQITSDLQQVQRELNRALESSGDDRIAAIRSAGQAVDAVIVDIEKAAESAPEGEIKTKLTELATKLRDAQTKIAGAVAAAGGAMDTAPTTTTP